MKSVAMNLLRLILAVAISLAKDVYADCEKSEYYSGISYLLPGGEPTSQAEWEELITQLYDLLRSSHVVVSYDDAWEALGVLDADPSDPSKVMLVYSNTSMEFEGHGLSTTWNREHVWPRSYGLFDNGPDYSDLHNLRPADANVNSARNNLYYDDCYPEVDSSCSRPAHSEAASDTAKNSFKFMPSAAEKGDLARAAFYDSLRYNGSYGASSERNTEQLTLSDCACVSRQMFGNLTTLLTWHMFDPVTAAEEARNDRTCSDFQYNRNPFVDFPWLAAMFTQPFLLSRVRSACPDEYVDPDSTVCVNMDPESPTRAPTIFDSAAPTMLSVSCPLFAGDVAIVSFNSDGIDSLTAVALADIVAGVDLYFTDIPWDGDKLVSSGEGLLKFKTTSTIPAGSTWYYPDGGASYGVWSVVSGSFNLAAAGDQILSFCGTPSAPIFLYGMTNNGWLEEGDLVSSLTSFLPESLNVSGAYSTLFSFDNQYYAGSFIGYKEILLLAMTDPSNWIVSDSAFAPLEIDSFTVFESTVAPTAKPSTSPTTMAGTVTKMDFTVTIVVDDVNTDAPTDSASSKALRLTLQDAIPDVSLGDINILAMVEVSGTADTLASYAVKYEVDIVLEDLGYTASDAQTVYLSWISAIDYSVSSGDFSNNLETNADDVNAEPLSVAVVDSSQNVGYSSLNLETVADSQEGTTHSITLGTRIGYMAFVCSMGFAAFAIIGSFVWGRKKFMERYHPYGYKKKPHVKKSPSSSALSECAKENLGEVTNGRTTFSNRGRKSDGCASISSVQHTTVNPMIGAGGDGL